MTEHAQVPWWLDILRREGVLTVLVLIWIFLIAIPESQDRRQTMAEMRGMCHQIVECEIDQAKASAALQEFQSRVTKEHEAFYEQQILLVATQEKILARLD